MFTGIIKEQGKIKSVRENPKLREIVVVVPRKKYSVSESVAVNGVCLTVVARKGTEHTFQIMPETLRLTTLQRVAKGDTVNIESSLRFGDSLGGHFVSGHVDAVGTVVAISSTKRGTIMRVQFPKKFQKLVAKKGSVALDGVSLTIAEAGQGWLEVALIPFTLAHTTLGRLKKKDLLNLEFDIFARYAQGR